MESAARASRKSWRTSDQQLRVRDGKTKETEQDRVHGESRRDQWDQSDDVPVERPGLVFHLKVSPAMNRKPLPFWATDSLGSRRS